MINPRRTILNTLQDNQLPGASYTFIPRQSRVSGGRTEAQPEPTPTATATPTPTVTATPTPTPTPSSVPASPCTEIVISALPTGFEALLGTYGIWDGGQIFASNEFAGNKSCDPGVVSDNTVAYTGTTGQGIIFFEQDYDQYFVTPNQTISCTGAPLSVAGGTAISSGENFTVVGGKGYPSVSVFEADVTYSYTGGCS
jgi:hypothetical protein